MFTAFLSISRAAKSQRCEYTLTDSNGVSSYYDLSEFYFSDGVHEVDDSDTTTNFIYKFNICGTIPPPVFVGNTTIPSYCLGSDKGPCIDFSDSNGTITCNQIYPDTSAQIVPSAVQIISFSGVDSECFWLSAELSDNIVDLTQFPNYNVELLDPSNSGSGVVFTMLNGQFCSAGYDMNRQLSVSLKCPDSTKTEWDADLARVITESVTESPTCHYHLTFESPLACPRQCVSEHSDRSTFAVCSTHGICAADPNAG